MQKYSFRPSGLEQYWKIYAGGERGLPKHAGSIKAKAYTSKGYDDRTGINSTALGASIEISGGIKGILKSGKLGSFLSENPMAKKLLDRLSKVPLEFAAIVEVEWLISRDNGKHYLQVSLAGEANAETGKLLKKAMVERDLLPENMPFNLILEGKRRYSCAVTVPLSSLSLSDINLEKGQDVVSGLMMACYHSFNPAVDVSDVSSHAVLGNSIYPFLNTDLYYTISNDSIVSTGHDYGRFGSWKIGIGAFDTIILTKNKHAAQMGYYPAKGNSFDSRIVVVTGGGESRKYDAHDGYRGVYFGEHGDVWNARKLESHAYLELYNAYNQKNPKTMGELVYNINDQKIVLLKSKGWESIDQAPLIIQESWKRINRAAELFQTNPYLAFQVLESSPLQPIYENPTFHLDYIFSLPIFLNGEFNKLLVDDMTTLPLQHVNMMDHFNEMIADDLGAPPGRFEGPAVVPVKIPDSFQLQDTDTGQTDSLYYYFVVTEDGTIALDGFEEYSRFGEVPGFSTLPGYDECAAKYGHNIASMIYSAAIQEYDEVRDIYSATYDSANVPELKTSTKEIKQEVVKGDNPGLLVYFQQVGPKGDKYYRYFYPKVTDRSAVETATLRYREEQLTGPGTGASSLVRNVEQKIDGTWTLSTTTELRNYGNLTVVKNIPADDPEHFDLDVAINFGSDEAGQGLFNNSVTAGAIGAKLGSTIGNFVSEDEIWKQLTVSPLLTTVGENLSEAIGIDMAKSRGDLSDDVLDVFNNVDYEFLGHLRDAAGGVVSSLLTAELIQAIEAEGLGAELASTVSNAVMGQISRNMITIGVNELTGGATSAALGNTTDLLSGVDLNLVGNAVASFIGSKLAEEALAGYDSEEEAIGAQIGGAAAGIATMFLVSTGPVGWAIAGLASFAGNFLGGTIGDLIHAARPEKASAQLVFNSETGEFEIDNVWSKRGGNVKGVKALADVAGDAMSNVLQAVEGEVIDGDAFSGLFLWKESRNLHGPGYFEKGTYFENAGGYGVWHNSVDDFNAVVEAGVIDMLGRLKIAGGNIYSKRALYNSLPDLLNEQNRPIEDPLQILAGNLRIATEYAAYLENKELINALIQSQPDSVFSAGWLATLARAAELGLNRRHACDFYGGWRYLLDGANASALLSGLTYEGDERLIALENGDIGLLLGDVVDSESKTLIHGSGVIDLRKSTRELLGNLQRDGDLLIDTRATQLPEEYQELRMEDGDLWLGDTRLAELGANGIVGWYSESDFFQVNDLKLRGFVNDLAKDLAEGRKRLVDGQLYDIVAEVGDDGTLTLMKDNESLDGARIQGGELIREGGVIAVMNEEGGFVPTHGEDISVSAVVYGSEEADTIYSGDLGNDIFTGGGDDTVHGGANADWIYGGEGDDSLYAGDVDGNALFGEMGNDELRGGAGSDWLEGGEGDDRLYGGDGGDVLQGDAGSDYLEGGLGGDTYVIRRGDGDTVIADHGDVGEAPSAVSNSWLLGQLQQLKDISFENGNAADINDILSFGPQIGLDDLTFERSGDDLLLRIAGAGDDTPELLTLTDWFTDMGRIEVLEFFDGIRIPIAKVDQFINGTAEDNLYAIEDIEGSTLINAMAGDDTIDLREAAVPVEDQSDTDRLWNSSLIIPIPSDEQADPKGGHVVNGGDGNDTLLGSAAEDVLLGGKGDDLLSGADGDDVLLGGIGKDDLAGGQGDDTLLGSEGDDHLAGGAGGDYLWGGIGDDLINGGAGSDTIEFGFGDGRDKLNDIHIYQPEESKIKALLEEIDVLLADETSSDEASGIEVESLTRVIFDVTAGESRADKLLSLMRDLESIVESANDVSAERVAKALRLLSEDLEQDKAHINKERLDLFMQEFRYLVLDTAGLLDIVNWSDGVEVGDIALAWEGDDLLLQLQGELPIVASDADLDPGQETPSASSDDAGAVSDEAANLDVLRLQEWGSTAPYIERFNFDSGQVEVANIESWLAGSDADDQLNGTQGHDWISGGIGMDFLAAAAGDDILNGNAGDDQLQGDDGDDLLNGGGGNDQLFGGDGDDIINGGSGDDQLSGGAGADKFDGGEGMDMVSYATATAGVHAYLDNGAMREIEHGLKGQVHEHLLGEGTIADRDALIKQLLEALPDPDELIRDVADVVPLPDKLQLIFTETLIAGQRDRAVELLQEIFDGSSELLKSDERASLLDSIEFVSLEPLPDEVDIDSYWEQVVNGLPDRGTVIERIADLVPSRKDQGERLAELLTTGDRAGLVKAVNTWLSSLYGEEAQAKAEEILAMIPDELPAIRSPIETLEEAAEVIETTDAILSFTSTVLDYGPEEEDTLGSFLRSDGKALSEERLISPFDDLAIKLDGYIYLEQGRHDFTVKSDDGFVLKIGGLNLSEKSGEEVSTDFETGFYRFELTYFDHQGDEELSVTSNSLADGNLLDVSIFYTDPLQVDPRLTELSDDNGRSYLSYPDTDEQGDHYENVEGIIGSAHDDLLWGDNGDNLLIGGDGADTLRGAGGNDSLQGGRGDDRYEFGRGDGQDLLRDSAGEDILMLGKDITPEQLWFSRNGDDLELSLIGSIDKLRIADWFSDANSHLETITTAAGQVLLDSQVESLVSAMSAFSPPDMGDATFGLPQEERNSLSAVIAASWQ
jgi:Ca2+-binding RTX toxin-like protein